MKRVGRAAAQLTLTPADRVPRAERARLINEAYAGYFVPLTVTEEQVARMDAAYDADLSRSVVALVDAQPVGLALLGRRGSRGWVHSVGTLPSWRRCGIAKAMVAQLIANACEAGLEELSLEVVAQNLPALRLYGALGFTERRELLTWRRQADEDPLPIPARRLVPADRADLFDAIAHWQAAAGSDGGREAPCWQLALESLKKMDGHLEGYWLSGASGGRVAKKPVRDREGRDSNAEGCCLIGGAAHGAAIMAVRVRPGADVLSTGRELLQAIAAIHPRQALAMSNVPADSFLCRILAALRFTVTVRQFEMGLRLS